MRSFLVALLAPLALVSGASAAPARQATPSVESLAPLAVDPEVRWAYGPLAFEGPPVLARTGEGERVLVHGRDPTGRRALIVLDGHSGRMLSRTLLAAPAPLALASDGERVAVRSAPNRVELYRLSGARLLLERSFSAPDSISAPVFAEGELFLREGAELACYDPEQREPRWRARVAGAFHGTPAVRGASVFAGWYAEDGTAHVAWLERASGRARGDLALGHHASGKHPEPDAFTLEAHAKFLFARVAPGLLASSGQTFDWARIPFDGERLGSATLHAFLAAPLELDGGAGDGWVAPERTSDDSMRWLLARRDPADGSERVIELAASTHHAWLCQSPVAGSRAGDVLYLGPAAVDAGTLQVLWRRARAPDFRPLPVAGGLLVIEGDRLQRLGGPEVPPDPVAARAAALAASEEKDLGEHLAQLAAQALRAGEIELAQRLVPEAEALGASGHTLALVRTESERPRAAAPDARGSSRRAALLAEETSARAAVPHALAEAAGLARDARERRALLGELFRRDADNADGLQALQRLLPEGLHVQEAPALDWLELLAAADAHPLELVEPPVEGEQATPAQARLASEREHWRPDARAYQSGRLVLVTAGASPRAIAHTLRSGELLADVLEKVFDGARPGAQRLELVLYPTRAEYLEHSGSDLGGLESVLGFTAGHFDLAAQVSRLFLPDEDPDDARLLAVSAHELTHHWLAIASRCAPLRATKETPGFWVVEAIATWAEELRLDVERGTWSTDPARAASLDTLAHAEAKDLIPWSKLLALPFSGFCTLETRPTCLLELDWQLGSHAPRSQMQLFYAQGAAVAHYLYEADQGRQRELLLEAVAGYYRGTPLDVAATLRVSPDELGARVEAWVRGSRGER